jgi:putative addiction module component (TIGR02574 family)
MNNKAQAILADALSLSDKDRADLAGKLIESLDPEVDSDWEEAWSVEIARRLEQLDQGLEKTVPWEEARRQIMESSDDPRAG